MVPRSGRTRFRCSCRTDSKSPRGGVARKVVPRRRPGPRDHLHPSRTAPSGPNCGASFLGVDGRFVRPLNPHSGCFFLGLDQMRHLGAAARLPRAGLRVHRPPGDAASLGVMRDVSSLQARPRGRQLPGDRPLRHRLHRQPPPRTDTVRLGCPQVSLLSLETQVIIRSRRPTPAFGRMSVPSHMSVRPWASVHVGGSHLSASPPDDLLGHRPLTPPVLLEDHRQRRLDVDDLDPRPVVGEQVDPSPPGLPQQVRGVEGERPARPQVVPGTAPGPPGSPRPGRRSARRRARPARRRARPPAARGGASPARCPCPQPGRPDIIVTVQR